MWARWMNVAFGSWLVVSGWVLAANHFVVSGPSGEAVAAAAETDAMMWNNAVTGVLVVLCAGMAMTSAFAEVRWVNLAAGFWAMISPSFVPYAFGSVATSNVVTGVLIMLMSLVPLYGTYGGWAGPPETTDRSGPDDYDRSSTTPIIGPMV